MVLKLGTLVVDIDGNTDPLKASEAEVAGSTKRIEKQFANIDRAATKAAKGGMRNMQFATRQLGFQLQDVVVQLQGGQNAMLVLGQQGSQLASVFSPMGGLVVALAAALGGSLMPSLFDSADASEALEDALKSLGEVAVETEDDIIVLTEKIADLAKESEAAAQAEIRGGIVTGIEAIGEAARGAADLLDDELGVAVQNVSGRMRRGLENRLERVAEKFGITREELQKVREEFQNFDQDRNADTLQNLQDAIDGIVAANQKATPEFVKLANSLREYSSGATDAQERVNRLKEIQNDLTAAVIESDKAFSENRSESAIKSRLDALERLGDSEREAILRLEEERRAFVLEQDQLTAEQRNQLLENIAMDREQSMRDINERQIANDERFAQRSLKIARDRAKAQMDAVNTAANAISNVLAASGDEQSARAAAALNQISSLATTIMSVMQAQAQAQALGDPSAITVPQKIANAALIASQFVGLFSLLRGAGRQFGGTVSPALAHPVNEGGVPEVLTQGGKQFLLPNGQGGTVSPISSSSMGSPQITLINNGTPQTITRSEVTKAGVQIMIDDAMKQTEDRINTSLGSGRGDTFNALMRSTRIERNIR